MLTYPELLAVVAGVTEVVKTKFNLVDTAAEVLSAVIGVGFGSAYQYALEVPTTFEGWFTVLTTGVITWLTTSGFYKLVLSPVKKAASAYIESKKSE